VSDQDVGDIKRALSDPTRVLEGLGIMGEGKARSRQAGGWLIRCPVHQDATPSCSVQQRGGVLLWKCHGCDAGGDVLSLIAAVRGWKIESQFKSVLLEAARLGGLWYLVDKLEGRVPREERPAAPPAPAAEPEPPREWPAQQDVEALWQACEPVCDDTVVADHLRARSLNPDVVAAKDLARVLPLDRNCALPKWASYWGGDKVRGPWTRTGHRLIVPMYDYLGQMRSVRAWRVIDGESPKRLPPGGHKASEMVMCDAFALQMLRTFGSSEPYKPYRLVIVEGEPDFLSRAIVTNDPHTAVVGIVSGSWTKTIASRVPFGCRVAIRTDVDKAGERYAVEIEDTLRRSAFLSRLTA